MSKKTDELEKELAQAQAIIDQLTITNGELHEEGMTLHSEKALLKAQLEALKSGIEAASCEPPKPRQPTIGEKNQDSPIGGGWRGHLSGHIHGCEGTEIEVSQITLKISKKVAFWLCMLLDDRTIKEVRAKKWIDDEGQKGLSNLGAAVGRLIDNSTANNGERQEIK